MFLIEEIWRKLWLKELFSSGFEACCPVIVFFSGKILPKMSTLLSHRKRLE